METQIEQMKEKLVQKLEKEFEDFKQELKQKTPEEIIEKSYEITFREETISILNGCNLDKNEIKALLNTDKALDKMYKKYMNIETSMLDTMADIVKDILSDIDKEYIKKLKKVR